MATRVQVLGVPDWSALDMLPRMFEVGVGATAIILVVGLILWAVSGRASASERHLIWMAGLLAVMLLPVLEVTVPRWATLATPAGLDAAWTEWSTLPLPGGEPVLSTDLDINSGATNGMGPTPGAAVVVDRPQGALFAALRASSVPGLLLGLWAVGALLLASRLLVRRWARWRVILPGAQALPPALAQKVAMVEAQAAPRASVRWILSERIAVPVTWGTLRPVIALPEAARSWPTRRLRAALLHELAHVRRRDHLVQTLADLACAVHWPNPLVWWAGRRLRAEAEQACDDQALTAGGRLSDYATELLAVAKGAVAHRGPRPGVAMASGGALGRRLEAILDPERRRTSPKRGTTAWVLTLTAALAVPLAALAPEPGASPVPASLPAALPSPPGPRDATALPQPEVVPALCAPPEIGGGLTEEVTGPRGRFHVSWRRAECAVNIEFERITFETRGPEPVSVLPGGDFVLQQTQGGEVLAARIASGAPPRFHRGHQEVDASEALTEWVRATVDFLRTVTSHEAEAWAVELLEEEGIEGLDAELERQPSTHLVALYIRGALASSLLEPDDLPVLEERARQRLSGEASLSGILDQIAAARRRN